jgi:hypothetical protein
MTSDHRKKVSHHAPCKSSSSLSKRKRERTSQGKLTLGSAEVQHVPVLHEHVDLLHARDRLHVQLLQRALEFLVVLRVRRFRPGHDLSPHGALPAYKIVTRKKRCQQKQSLYEANTQHANANAPTHQKQSARVLRKTKEHAPNAPILFAAACAFSLASFAWSILVDFSVFFYRKETPPFRGRSVGSVDALCLCRSAAQKTRFPAKYQ